MSEQEKVETIVEEVVESTPVVEVATSVSKSSNKNKYIGYGVALVLVVGILVGVLYVLEKEGRSSTGVFDTIIAKQEAGKVVATVNGEEIVSADLSTSIQQFTQAAVAQGVDATSPDIQAEIRSQSLEVLVNTELLKQAAAEKGIEVSSDEVAERLVTISTDIGGEEVLAERMASLGIDEEKLHSDIHDELMIQQLLDIVFADAVIEVTEEEVNTVYENAGGVAAGLPPLEEVRTQIEEQIKTSKEQEVIDAYLKDLKADAEVEIK